MSHNFVSEMRSSSNPFYTKRFRPLAGDGVPDESAGLGEGPDSLYAELPPNAGLAAAAERQARVLGGQAVAVDADRPRDQLPRDPVGKCVVTGPDRRGKTEFCCVRCGYGIVDALVAEDRQRRTELFLGGQRRVRGQTGDDGRQREVAAPVGIRLADLSRG